MKQTAVEWLIEYCDKEVGYIPIEIIEQAKAIEREQIIDAYNKGEFNQGCNGNAEQYYKETYESNT